ncbi:MAG: bifunctional folylpolyglutamate synthase/dihydrofolate synthase [Deltaproteobacteria bacterium]|jgi:dihydrofolate synthase/folylpolyglutamate synthase|nr:bifunctional folylpolyglutamate synthase/dihydrofolate synthase [Deltaproteobacteria bacterium]
MPPRFSAWKDFAAHLDSLGLFRMRPGLERMGAALDRMNLRRSSMPLVQVVGTNGKGSCCTFLASLGRAHGLSCGLASSPHFVSVRERARLFRPGGTVGGALVPEPSWLAAAEAVLAGGGDDLSYFELITAMALYIFKEERVDLAVMESGLGGTFDATTALEADLLIFTPIDLDHRNVLGRSLTDIAQDKAGALRRGKAAFSAPQAMEAKAALEREAQKKDAPLHFTPADLPAGFTAQGHKLKLAGIHQRANAAPALAAWRALAPLLLPAYAPPDAEEISPLEIQGLTEAWLPGRLQFIAPQPEKRLPALLLDGGHNPHGLAALGRSLAAMNLAPGAVIFTCMADKEPEELIPHLRALAAGGPILVPALPDNPRALPPHTLCNLIGLNAMPFAGLSQALSWAWTYFCQRLPEETGRDITPACGAGGRPLLICGSLYLLGEFYALHPHHLTPKD